MKRGIRQGSALSAKLYLVFIDELLRKVESTKQGAILIGLNVNIPTQADDICLVASSQVDMQVLISMCEIYSKQWRFNFSPTKSAVMLFSDNRNTRNGSAYNFKMFDEPIKICTSVKHVGVLLSSDNSNIERTMHACRTIRALTMSMIRSGSHPAALNPMTSSKLVKCIIFPKALYGCELWLLSQSEILLLERAQRFFLNQFKVLLLLQGQTCAMVYWDGQQLKHILILKSFCLSEIYVG